jgi:hypothetical protein
MEGLLYKMSIYNCRQWVFVIDVEGLCRVISFRAKYTDIGPLASAERAKEAKATQSSIKDNLCLKKEYLTER